MTTDTVTTDTGDTPLPAATDPPDREQPALGIGPLPEPTLTLREASDATGASVSAMRKAIRAGRLSSEVIEGPNGPEHRVTVSAVRAALPKATASPVVVVKGDGDRADRGAIPREHLSEFLTHVTEQLRQADARAARAEGERDTLRAELERAQRELAGVRDELLALPTGTVSGQPSTPGGDPVPEGMVMVRRRWWHRRDPDRG